MQNLRPLKLNNIIGQTQVKKCIKVLLATYKRDPMPHMLWTGPPGTGKTTFATAVAHECGCKLWQANGGTIQSTKDIMPYLVRIQRGDIFFIDEIHRMNIRVQESMFTVMEDYRYDIARGAKSMDVEPFTLIGATTDVGMLLQPFFDRFKHCFQLSSYDLNEMKELIYMNADKLRIGITDDAVAGLAKRSRWTPRVANSLLEWCRDYALSDNKTIIDKDILEKAMILKGIDRYGFNRDDWKYINVLKRAKRPMGLNTLASATNIAKITIENRIEPHLIRCGLIEKTQKGRMLCQQK